MVHRRFGSALFVLCIVAALFSIGAMLITNMPGISYRGALAPLTLPQIDLRQRLHTHVNTLAGAIGERNLQRYSSLNAAAQYISDTFVSFGYEPVAQAFTVDGKTVKNLEAVKQGGAGDKILVIGAHYDSVSGSPGANDNGTGIAAVLEIARLLRNRSVFHTVRFVAFVNEEPPYTYTKAMGSRRYAERAASRNEPITAMLSLETIGYYSEEVHSQQYPFPFSWFYPSTGDFIGFVANLRSRALVRQAINSFRTHARFPSEGVAAPGWITGINWSDHWSFWKAGYPAIMVTDTALFRYPQYHTVADLPEIVDYDRLTQVVSGLAEVVADLANAT